MNAKITAVCLLSALSISVIAAPKAHAVGCLSGAVAGGVAGHMLHHHAVLGAVGGCIAGHELAKHEAKTKADQLNQQQLDKMQPAAPSTDKSM
jgi:outer membrane lipoprotein SlyB